MKFFSLMRDGHFWSLRMRQVVLSFGVVVIVGLLAGCGEGAEDENKDDKQEQKAPIPVEVAIVGKGSISQTYRAITTLEAENEAQVVARSTGILEMLLVEEGDLVEKGQLLAQLDIEQLTLEVSQIEATVKKLKNELTRQEQLFKRKLGSSDALDRARFEYQSQQAQLQLSKLRLNYASIRAPISGIVTQRAAKQGNLIRDNELLFTVVDLDSLVAMLFLPEKELSKVKKGQQVVLQIDALGDELVVGVIDRVRPAIDTSTGTFRVVVNVPNTEHRLKSGMFGKAEVVFDTRDDVLVLQQQAVISQDNRSHVFVVVDNKAMQRSIETGYAHNGMIEVSGGLELGDVVITTGQQIMKHETLVEVVDDDANDHSRQVKSVTANNLSDDSQ